MSEGLRFQRFLSERVACVYGPRWTGVVEKDVTDTAKTIHSLQVLDALRDAAVVLSKSGSSQSRTSGGMQYLRYGASRRLLMMWHAYRNVVVYSAPPRRLEPLSADESAELTRDLNVIYLNIRGTLDNLAWALLHEFAQEKLKIHPTKIGLFKSCITDDNRFDGLSLALNAHREWNFDLADRRDPSAHRIPLTIPPQVLSPKDSSAYAQLLNEYVRATQDLDFAVAEQKLKQIERIGQFYPYFIHDIDRGPFPIYPTLPEDVAHVVEICRDVGSLFSAAS